jgi:nucleoside-diphosphate-sugar epimerase
MKELRIPKGVYTSTLAVNGDTHGKLVNESYRTPGGPWLSEYDRTKWVAHHEVAEPMIADGLPLVIVMPGAAYGPGDTSALGETLEMYLRRRLPLAPRATAFCWGHVDDTAHAHLLAMERGTPGESYIIGGPPHTLIDALALAEASTGIKAPRVHPSPSMMRVSAGVTYIGDNAKAKATLGYDPRPLGQGLPEALAYDMQRLGIVAPRV